MAKITLVGEVLAAGSMARIWCHVFWFVCQISAMIIFFGAGKALDMRVQRAVVLDPQPWPSYGAGSKR